MNEFLRKIMELGAELDKSHDGFRNNMIINDAEKLYVQHIFEVKLSIKTIEEYTDESKEWKEFLTRECLRKKSFRN